MVKSYFPLFALLWSLFILSCGSPEPNQGQDTGKQIVEDGPSELSYPFTVILDSLAPEQMQFLFPPGDRIGNVWVKRMFIAFIILALAKIVFSP